MRLPQPLLLCVLAACAPAARPPADPAPASQGEREALMEADRAFAADVAARRLDGWMSAHAADAVRLHMGGRVAQGLDAIREFDAPLFADSTTRLLWAPTAAGTFRDGQYGFTTGRSVMIRPRGSAAADTLYSGTYVTLWRKDPDGRWKVVLDTGAADPRP